jgi:hypothetical protein
MKRYKLLHRLSAWTVIASLLFMHVAVAAYACPAPAPEVAQSCVGGMDADNPALCKKHGETRLQLVGGNVPTVPPAVIIAVLIPPPPLIDLDAVAAPRQGSFYLSRLARDGSPPLFLRFQVLLT